MRKTLAAALAFASLGLAGGALAADYPSKTITMVVPYGAGGITDVMARATARMLEEELGETIVVVNKAGAAGTVGLTAVARDRPDGYTIAMVPAAPLIIQPHLRPVGYDLSSYDYICRVFDAPIVLATAGDSEFADFADVVEYAKAHPGELTYSSAGPGSLPHIGMVRAIKGLGVEMRHVPMEGDAGAVTAAQGGHVNLAAVGGSSVVGKDVKTIAVFSDERMESVPDAKTAKEVGLDVNMSLWGGIIAPKGIPDEARARLASACQSVVETEAFDQEMARMASRAAYADPDGFREVVAEDSAANAEVIGALGMGKK
ncbi:tripartite tricarboxylate transporter substrate binding protein [Acuticoccus sediminis]|uniref:Tripartite tricarboxylate transporter substrate binding protein n=1 Tax=Acuticoccus sediminis TaxID=2184697 RepID=A0A8B2NNJ2_9HYPH|nr:tripartite tricarboxylate transporter substrate binding protein [Acuticoccus sediminis]RAI00181.1 tripartite tricarboxylate transporter substrate binding protein [Acuticoccus sediminis]